jgi:hypothetical protein
MNIETAAPTALPGDLRLALIEGLKAGHTHGLNAAAAVLRAHVDRWRASGDETERVTAIIFEMAAREIDRQPRDDEGGPGDGHPSTDDGRVLNFTEWAARLSARPKVAGR